MEFDSLLRQSIGTKQTLNHLGLTKCERLSTLKSEKKQHPYLFQLFTLFIFLSVFGFGCGKRRPPVPPATSRQINQNNFAVTQQGNKIAITIPLTDKRGGALPRQVDVFRLAESLESPSFLTEEEFASRSTQIGSLRLPNDLSQNQAVFFDTIAPSAQSRRLRYAVRFVDGDGRRSPFSNFVFFEPLRNAANPPVLNQPLVSQTEVKLNWQAPEDNVDNSKPANILGFNIYRQSTKVRQPAKLNDSLLSENDFEDRNFQFGEQYEYFVRTVSSGVNGAQIESDDSNRIQIVPRDVFPPRPPEGLTIAAAPGNLSVFFAANQETDIIGYNIFRTTDPSLPPQQWQKLNEATIAATSYQDTKVESGRKYYYYVAAVDSAGNVSQPSATVSETAP